MGSERLDTMESKSRESFTPKNSTKPKKSEYREFSAQRKKPNFQRGQSLGHNSLTGTPKFNRKPPQPGSIILNQFKNSKVSPVENSDNLIAINLDFSKGGDSKASFQKEEESRESEPGSPPGGGLSSAISSLRTETEKCLEREQENIKSPKSDSFYKEIEVPLLKLKEIKKKKKMII